MSDNGAGPPSVPIQPVPMQWSYATIEGVVTDPSGMQQPIRLVQIRVSHASGVFIAMVTAEEAEGISSNIHKQATRTKSGFIIPGDDFRGLGE